MTARLNPATTLRKKLGKLLENISTIDIIESLSIIQKTQPKPSDTASSEQKLQPPAWKKNRVESPSNPFYHYTPGSTINISSTDAFSSTATSAFGRFPFQSRQRKTELLEPYGLRSPPPSPDFGISDLWEAAESEKEEEELEDQEFTYQNPITESPEVETLNLQAQQNLNIDNLKIETPNQQRQNNPKPELIN
ncbi:hypothetical protein G9A89_021624 [Geosiphon pyriformis]|nr:hypothetical protein G9A89_021624 [Geosiphon pyriformis]